VAILPVIIAPDSRLKVRCQAVERIDDEERRLIYDLLESMRAANGIGLAAPQVGVSRRVIAIDVHGEDEDPKPLALANPEILSTSDEEVTNEEGCLSLPEYYADVRRPAAVRVRYLDRDGEGRKLAATGLLATCIQHEMDHLDGVLFVDHVSALKRNIILRKLGKMKRAASEAAE